MAPKKQPSNARIPSPFVVWWETRGSELVKHLNIQGEDVQEFCRQVWNAGVGQVTDYTRVTAAEMWRKCVEPMNRGAKRNDSESDDYMQAKPDLCGNDKPIALQTDITGADEPINRETIKPLFEKQNAEPAGLFD